MLSLPSTPAIALIEFCTGINIIQHLSQKQQLTGSRENMIHFHSCTFINSVRRLKKMIYNQAPLQKCFNPIIIVGDTFGQQTAGL